MGVNADREIADNSYHPSHLTSVDNTTVATIKLVPFHTHSAYAVSTEVLTFSLNIHSLLLPVHCDITPQSCSPNVTMVTARHDLPQYL
jgi:hypothetical protein